MQSELVTVDKFESLPIAELARLHLESNGIPAFLASAESAQVLSCIGTVGPKVRLQVPTANAEMARQLLREAVHLRNQTTPRTGIAAEAIRCLACQQPMGTSQVACSNCGWTYCDGKADTLPEWSFPDRDEPAGAGGPMAWLVNMQRPIIWLLLLPFLLIMVWQLIAMLISLTTLATASLYHSSESRSHISAWPSIKSSYVACPI